MQRWILTAILALVILGSFIVIAVVGYASIKGLARNPSAAPKIQMAMLLAFLFSAGIAIVSLLLYYVFSSSPS